MFMFLQLSLHSHAIHTYTVTNVLTVFQFQRHLPFNISPLLLKAFSQWLSFIST